MSSFESSFTPVTNGVHLLSWLSGGLAALFAFVGMMGTKNNRERLERIPLLVLLSAPLSHAASATAPSQFVSTTAAIERAANR